MGRIHQRVVETFWAVTWNVYFATKTKVLDPVMDKLFGLGVTLFIMQEASGQDITHWLERRGLKTKVFDEYRVAWDPDVWEYLSHNERIVSDVPMFRTGSAKPVFKYILIVRLRHKLTGKKLKVVCYHTPSHIQRPEWNRAAPNRWQIFKDAMFLFKEMAANSMIRHLLFAGDDNADESKASGGPLSRWDFARNNGLKLIQAPKPTHDSRRIDDFRTKNLDQLEEGVVGEGGGDHKFFACKFGFSKRRNKK